MLRSILTPHFSCNVRLRVRNCLKHLVKGSSYFSSSACDGFIPFESMVEQRRNQARRSIILEIFRDEDISFVQELCSSFGLIQQICHYEPDPKKKMMIVEFEKEESVKHIMWRARTGDGDKESILMPFLKLKLKYCVVPKVHKNEMSHSTIKESIPQLQDAIYHMNVNCDTVSQQIQYFYDHQKLSEIGWRLRFMTCRKVELLLPQFTHNRVLPFGSSVNTFGKHDCDLDMVIDVEQGTRGQADFPLMIPPKYKQSRNNIQKYLYIIADLMTRFEPGFDKIKKILHARVPIVKCKELFTGLECDITAGNRSGYEMSEVLYFYGCYDPRVVPLVFCIRHWAKVKKVTQKIPPGRSISNFSITLLVLFYFMNASPPIIPCIRTFINAKDKSEVKYTSQSTINQSSLEELLKNFFSFYTVFDYNKYGISLITGKVIAKPSYDPLYIQNPMDTVLNVSRNVNFEEINMFQQECKIAKLEFDNYSTKNNSNASLWGFNALACDTSLKLAGGQAGRVSSIDMSTLFEEENEDLVSKKKQNEKVKQGKLKSTQMAAAPVIFQNGKKSATLTSIEDSLHKITDKNRQHKPKKRKQQQISNPFFNF